MSNGNIVISRVANGITLNAGMGRDVLLGEDNQELTFGTPEEAREHLNQLCSDMSMEEIEEMILVEDIRFEERES